MRKQRLVVPFVLVWATGLASPPLLAQTSPSLILGRPTDESVTFNVRVNAGSVYFEWGTASEVYTATSAPVAIGNDPVRVRLDGLEANTRYYYRAHHRASGQATFTAGPEGTFRTQRARGAGFVFTIQSDSHQGFAAFHDRNLYEIAMQNQLADDPDFLIDLGDTFSLDGANEQTSTVRQKYLNQRDVFALAAHSVPVFLVLGNHENEEGWNLDDTQNPAASLPVMGTNARKRYFANPIPDGFYTGNEDTSIPSVEGDGLKENYYAFHWGDALFVMLDPFWYTMKKPFAGTLGGEANDEVVGERWDWTLGFEQYEWLRETLEASDAPYKFVFAHQLTGGTEDYGRGGANGAPYCEWGGYDPDGQTWSFDEKRPEFVAPIHDLFVANGVSAFFHGHDHAYATEERDGVVYQLCPHAANDSYGTGFGSNETTYAPAEVLPNSGHLRVSVASEQTSVEYVRAFLDGDEGDNREVAASYELLPNASNNKPEARDDSATAERLLPVEIRVLENDEDADGDALGVLGVTQPPRGRTTFDGNVVTYTPSICHDTAPDEFRYAVLDGRGGSATATVRVMAPCPGTPPEAGDDAFVVRSGERTVLDVLSNDLDVDGNLVREPQVVTAPSHGTLEPVDDGAFAYQSSADFLGEDGFSYSVCDSRGNCDSASVALTVVACLEDAHCGDAYACTTERCEDYSCVVAPVACDDGVPCTVDDCDAVEGCRHQAADDACDDADPCTLERCDLELGCVSTARDCGEADACQTPYCDAATGECRSELVDCDDGDRCTADSCDALLGCQHAPSDGTACDDGNACTREDVCSQGACAGVALECLDAVDGCQLAQCDPATGCALQEVEDGTACPGGVCRSGACAPLPGSPDAGRDAGADGGVGDASAPSSAHPDASSDGSRGRDAGVRPPVPPIVATVPPQPPPMPTSDAGAGHAPERQDASPVAPHRAGDAGAPLASVPRGEPGCACRTSSGANASAWWVLPLVALVRRRRQPRTAARGNAFPRG